MQKNDLIHLEVTDMGTDGAGIGRYEGMTFFIKDAVAGDTVRARVMKVKKNYGYARLEEVLIPSAYRVEPACELHRRCGGCQMQTLLYDRQLALKQKMVSEKLVRIGGFAPEVPACIFEPPVGMEQPYRYRNKALFPIGMGKEGEIAAGFYAARSHNIIPVSDCQLGVEENRAVLDCVLSYMKESHVRPYDETTGKGLIRHVLIRYGFVTGEIMVCVIINGSRLPAQQKLIEKLCKIRGMKSISLNQNKKNTNIIMGETTETIWGNGYITDYIYLRDPGSDFQRTDTAIAYQISPQSFYQVNPEQTEKLYSLALEYAGLTGKETVWDLYCGIGTISLFLAQRAGMVYGVEAVGQAVEDAKRNAVHNGITNAVFFEGKAEEVLPEFYQNGPAGRDDFHGEGADMRHPDVIVVDPPRKGCDARCLEVMLRMRPERIVYVSCDPATLARDLRILCDGGYEIRRGRVVDQFCHTMHVETVVLLSKVQK